MTIDYLLHWQSDCYTGFLVYVFCLKYMLMITCRKCIACVLLPHPQFSVPNENVLCILLNRSVAC